MRVLITGSGLVGCYCARSLLRQGYSVLLFDRQPSLAYAEAVTEHSIEVIEGDVRDVETLASVLAHGRVEIVIHAAGALKASFDRDTFDGYATNIYGTMCVAEAMCRAGGKRLLVCSSLAVYKFSTRVATMTEDHPVAPQDLYDHSKLLAESVVRPYCEAQRIELVVLRLAGVYGAGHFKGGGWMGKNLQQLLVEASNSRKVVIDWAKLGINEYLYVKDAAQAIVLASTAPLSQGETINIGPGRLTSPSEIGQAIAAVFPNVQVIQTNAYEGVTPAYLWRTAPLSISKAQKVLGYRPLYANIGEGIGDFAGELERLSDVLR